MLGLSSVSMFEQSTEISATQEIEKLFGSIPTKERDSVQLSY